jgi:calcium-dependent protein kinase
MGEKPDDVWACGIIMHTLLAGTVPYDGLTDQEIIDKITKEPIDYSLPDYADMDPCAKDLLSKILVLDSKSRITAAECLKHSWFNSCKDHNLNKDAMTRSISNLKSFSSRLKMQQAAMTLISTQMINNAEMTEMRAMFDKLDVNFDGKLTKEEVLEGFKAMEMENYEQEAENIFKNADFDDNGTLEFTEWCTATMDKRKMLSQKRLKQAFDMFDENGNGSISYLEVKKLLDHNGTTNGDYFKELIKEMDIDGDGEIQFPEFEKMMESLI